MCVYIYDVTTKVLLAVLTCVPEVILPAEVTQGKANNCLIF